MTKQDDTLQGILRQSPAEREQEIQETIQGIAEVLARESGRTPTECWSDALDLWRVQCPRIAPTEDWQQLSLLIDWPEQLACELIRPVVLFGFTSTERAQHTETAKRTLRRKAHRFDALGMVSLFADFHEPPHTDRRALPPPLRQLIVDRKTEVSLAIIGTSVLRLS